MTTFNPLVLVLYGIGAAMAWGSADYLAAHAAKRNSPNAATLGVSTIGTLLFTLLFLFNHGTGHWNISGVLYAIVAGISLELGLLVFFKGLNIGPVNLVSPISSAYPLVSTAIIVFAFGGSLKPIEIIGIAVVVSGIAIASGLFNTKKSDRNLNPGIAYALLTVPIWGIAYACMGKAVESLGWQKATLINFYAGLAILSVILPLIAGKQFWRTINGSLLKDKYVIAAAAAQSLGGVIFSIGLAHTRSSAVLIAVSASYPALTIYLAIKGLKEKVAVFSLIGASTTVVGIIMLSL